MRLFIGLVLVFAVGLGLTLAHSNFGRPQTPRSDIISTSEGNGHKLSAAQASAKYHPVITCESDMLAVMRGIPTVRRADALAKRVCPRLSATGQEHAARFVHWERKPSPAPKTSSTVKVPHVHL